MNSSFRTAFWAMCCGLTIPMMLFVGVELLSGGAPVANDSVGALEKRRNLRDHLKDTDGPLPLSRPLAKETPDRSHSAKRETRPKSPADDVPTPRKSQSPAVQLVPELAADDSEDTLEDAPPAPGQNGGGKNGLGHGNGAREVAGTSPGTKGASAGVILGPQLEIDPLPNKGGIDNRIPATPTHAAPRPQAVSDSEQAVSAAPGSAVDARLSSIQQNVEQIARTIAAQAALVPVDPLKQATQFLEHLEQARRLQKLAVREPSIAPLPHGDDDDESADGKPAHDRETGGRQEPSSSDAAPPSSAARLMTKIYRPRYLGAAALKALVVPLLTDGIGKAGAAGSVGDETAFDDTPASAAGSTEALVVRDTAEVLKRIDRLVQELDVAPAHIFLEATILSVRLHPVRPTGINLVEFNSTSQPFAVSIEGSRPGSADTVDHIRASAGTFLTHGAGVKCGVLHGDPRAFIQALQASQQTENSAAWQLTLLNKQSADLLVPAGAFGSAASGTVLRLRPVMTRDGVIHLEVRPEAGPSAAAWNGPSQVPPNQFTLHEGDTAIVAGLTEEHLVTHTFRDPVFGDIPVVGRMFRKQAGIPQRTEVVVLLTPHVVSPERGSMTPQTVRRVRPQGVTGQSGVKPATASKPAKSEALQGVASLSRDASQSGPARGARLGTRVASPRPNSRVQRTPAALAVGTDAGPKSDDRHPVPTEKSPEESTQVEELSAPSPIPELLPPSRANEELEPPPRLLPSSDLVAPPTITPAAHERSHPQIQYKPFHPNR